MRLTRRALPFAISLVLLWPTGALAGTKHISIVDLAFQPSGARVIPGAIVQWTNDGSVVHTATGDGLGPCCPSGPGLWNSGPIQPGASFQFTLASAGRFTYHCNRHPAQMTGSINVKMVAKPAHGTTATVFHIFWASPNGGVPTGFNEDVQIDTPGPDNFQDWRVDQAPGSFESDFTPDAGTGTYLFRARLQNSSTGEVSGWSFEAAINVTSIGR
jgi:plastocyanin